MALAGLGRFLHPNLTQEQMTPSELYFRVRLKEGRVFPDEIVKLLPHLPRDHPLAKEWLVRADSCSRVLQHLTRLARPLKILDYGCGNGWLSNQLSKIQSFHIWGIDRISPELVQASRLFSRANSVFLAGDTFEVPFLRHSMDIILLVSVIQYFPDLNRLIELLLDLLKPKGEIHIFDSPLYQSEDIPAAAWRTKTYYADLGFPEMTTHYFHHRVSELVPYSPQWQYDPRWLKSRLKRVLGMEVSPFPWLILS
jgi:SAM-dependent methyltransferase